MQILLLPVFVAGAVLAVTIPFLIAYLPILAVYFVVLFFVYLVTGNWLQPSIESLYQAYGANSEISIQVDFMSGLLSHAVGFHQMLAEAASWDIIYGLPAFVGIFFLPFFVVALCAGFVWLIYDSWEVLLYEPKDRKLR